MTEDPFFELLPTNDQHHYRVGKRGEAKNEQMQKYLSRQSVSSEESIEESRASHSVNIIIKSTRHKKQNLVLPPATSKEFLERAEEFAKRNVRGGTPQVTRKKQDYTALTSDFNFHNLAPHQSDFISLYQYKNPARHSRSTAKKHKAFRSNNASTGRKRFSSSHNTAQFKRAMMAQK